LRKGILLFLCATVFAAPPMPKRASIRIPAWVESSAEAQPDTPTLKFEAKLDGQPARVLAVRRPADDLLLLVVLDLTGDFALVQSAKEALAEEVHKLPGYVRAGLLRAQDGLRVIVDPTADRNAIAQAIHEAPVSGKAGLLDTVETVETIADAVLAKSTVRVAVLYITDSDIANYRDDYTNPVINSSDSHDLSRRFPEALVQEKITRLAAKLAVHQAPLFVLHLKYRDDRLNEAYQIGLKELAVTTAGASAFCRSNAEIGPALNSLFETIRAHYSLSLEVPVRCRRNMEVQVSLPGGDRALSYRTRLSLKEVAK
jgi:hypothetical protein